MKKFASAVKNIVKTAAESNFVLYAGSWSFFFLLSAVPLVLLLVMACDAFGVDASFLLDEMPAIEEMIDDEPEAPQEDEKVVIPPMESASTSLAALFPKMED